MTNEELWTKIERGLGNLTPYSQLYFSVQIVGHCNLGCKQCCHFSPLAGEEYLDINSYKKDCDRLSKLFDGEAFGITLSGGEPLLHPQLTEFISITREAFPVSQISILTNGLLLPTMPEFFWDACKKHDIIIRTTCYPVIDYADAKMIADSKGVKYIPPNVEHTNQFKQYPMRSRASFTNDISRVNFLNCRFAHCITLKNGEMYPCSQAANVSYLSNYFNLDMHLSEKKGVNIYSVKSGDELLEKLARPIPLCRHCDVTEQRISCDWGMTKKDRYEWLAFEFTADDIHYLKSKTPVVYVFGAGGWGKITVDLLKNEGIAIKSVLSTRKKQGIDNILGVPVVTLDELGEVEPNSICLVALSTAIYKSEVYPLLSPIGFEDVVPVSGIVY